MKDSLLSYIEKFENFRRISLFAVIVIGTLFLYSTATLNHTLMWVSMLSLYAFVLSLSLHSRSRKEVVLFSILYFFIIVRTGHYIRLLFQDGYTVLPADSSFSRYLIERIIEDGEVLPGRYIGFARDYSYYPLPFIFSAIFLMTTTISLEAFAGLIYHVTVDLVTILALYLTLSLFATRLDMKGNLATFALATFLSNVRFLHLFRQFRYENIAFLHLVMMSYLIVRLLTNKADNNFKSMTVPLIISLLAASITLSHKTTWFFELLFISIVLTWLISYKILRSVNKSSSVSKTVISSALLSILTTAISLVYTTAQMSIDLTYVIITSIMEAFLGEEETPIGLEKFNPYDYTRLEIGIILIGNAIMAILLTTSFLKLFLNTIKNKDPYHLLLASLTGIFGLLSFIIIVFSPFRVTVFERAYLYLLWFGCLLPAYLISRAKRKQFLNILAIVTIVLFFVSQTLIRHQDHALAVDRVIRYGIVYETGKFLAKHGVFERGLIAGFPQHVFTIASTAIGVEIHPLRHRPFYFLFLNRTFEIISERDIFLFYDMPPEKLRMIVPPQYIKPFVKTSSSLPKIINVVFNVGYVKAYKS